MDDRVHTTDGTMSSRGNGPTVAIPRSVVDHEAEYEMTEPGIGYRLREPYDHTP
jgi:hypothetical protein